MDGGELPYTTEGLAWPFQRAVKSQPTTLPRVLESHIGQTRMRELFGMRKEDREVLRSNHVALAKELVAGELLQHLLAQDIITEEMLELIEAKCGNFGRNVELLRLLPKRGPRAFDTFRWALIETKQHHLARLIEPGLSEEESGNTENGDEQCVKLSRPVQELEFSFPSKRPRCTETMECSLDDGDGPGCFLVQPCTTEFYNTHQLSSYRMQSRPRGFAIIVSNVTFGGVHELVDRQGGEVDHSVLSQLFAGLGFQVRMVNNQSAQVMETELLSFASLLEHRSFDSCIVALLSHGVEGAIYGTDGKLLQIQDIFRLFDNDNCPQLQNKPKMFFIQACRGDETDSGVDLQDGKERSDSPGWEQCDAGREEPLRVKLPTRSDIICGYACLKGTAALRNTRRGSWYVQALTHVLASHAKDMHVADMLVKVNSLIKAREGFSPGTEFHRCKEMSEYSSTLCKDLHLFPGYCEEK